MKKVFDRNLASLCGKSSEETGIEGLYLNKIKAVYVINLYTTSY